MSAAAPNPLLKFDLGLSLGAIELGVLFSTLFYGMTLVQGYTYGATCSQDRLWLKIFVGLVCVLETLHTGLVWTYLYHLTVGSFGNPFALLELPWYFDVSIGVQGCISTSVQVFYTWRIYGVSKKAWLVGPVFLAELFRLGMCVTIAALAWYEGNLPAFRAHYDYIVYITLVSSAAIDLWNTSVLCFYLRSRRTNISKTLDIVNSIMLWAIETGLITTTTAALVLIFWSTMPDNGLWACFLIIYAKMFSNSLLVSLNSRSSIREASSRQGAHLAQSGAGISVSRSYNVEISAADGTVSTADADVPLDDLKTYDRHYAV